MVEPRGPMGRGPESAEDREARRAERQGRGPATADELAAINARRAARNLPPKGADEPLNETDLDDLEAAEAEAEGGTEGAAPA